MNKDLAPFNIELLVPKDSFIRATTPITDLAIFESNTKNFSSEGIFSTEIFGMVGSEERNIKFSYIDLNVVIFHPIVYKALGNLKTLYKEILEGRKFAKFDKKLKDFIPSNIEEGRTGFNFFMEHFKEIKYEERESESRDFNIKLIYKNLNSCTYGKLLVMPAGLRDYTVDNNGKPSEDEINSLYRKIMNISNFIGVEVKPDDMETIDHSRARLQSAVNNVYEYIRDIVDGKKKFGQGKWSKRAIFSGTRNVLTATPITILDKNDPFKVGFNDTIIGLYQLSKSIVNITTHRLKTEVVNYVFSGTSNTAKLINKDTLAVEEVEVKNKDKDLWTSDDGLEQVLNSLAHVSIMDNPVMVGDHYLILLYRDKNSFRLVQDINSVPESFDKRFIKPITLSELVYLSIYEIVKDHPAILTRFPVAGLGGVYPTNSYLKTTVRGERLNKLDLLWNKSKTTYPEFPIAGTEYFTSLSPHPSRLSRLGADFDGDKSSYSSLATTDSNNEIKKLMRSRNFYIAPGGDLTYSASTSVIDLLMSSITG